MTETAGQHGRLEATLGSGRGKLTVDVDEQSIACIKCRFENHDIQATLPISISRIIEVSPEASNIYSTETLTIGQISTNTTSVSCSWQEILCTSLYPSVARVNSIQLAGKLRSYKAFQVGQGVCQSHLHR